MKWSEIPCEGIHRPVDENIRSVLGYLLVNLGVDLENIPTIMFEKYHLYTKTTVNSNADDAWETKKVYLSDIVGTTYKGYGGKSVIEAFLELKRVASYIKQNRISRGKYHYMMKRRSPNPIRLAQLQDNGKYVVTGGNHRVIIYKLMMLSEIAQTYEWACSDTFDSDFLGFDSIRKKYWILAEVDISGKSEVILSET